MAAPSRSKNQPIIEQSIRPRISVVGVGGAGGNAINNMIRAKLEGVDFYAANTDAQALDGSLVLEENRIKLGIHVTQGLGAGSKSEVGRAAAEESIETVIDQLQGSNMVFITAGMGGGTGTGAAPVIARASRESGILTVGVVTKPFHFEGSHRMRTAEKGIEELQQYVDTLIVIPNQNLFRIANERTTFADAFKMADDVLYSGVRGVTDLMIMPGLINLDFADIRSVMSEMGKAMMGTGEADGDRRALDAAEAAISNPLLDDVSMKGARGVLINITGGYDMTLYEVDEAANRIRDDVDPEANIIFGSTFDEKLNGRMRVSVVATGIGPVAMPQNIKTQNTQTKVEPTFNNFNQRPEPTGYTMPVHAPQPRQHHFSDPVAPVFETTESATHEEFMAASHEQTPAFVNSYSEQPQENMENNEQEHTIVQPEKKRSTSLFERFTGASRAKAQATPQAPVTEQTLKNSTMDSAKDSDFLDIPAFLRRGNNNQ
ncbi:MAG: cell division protein FtsZ [Proteobacteria bacterium]|nr:cell division protein FtsZ [Pseudomonadota bacterium]